MAVYFILLMLQITVFTRITAAPDYATPSNNLDFPENYPVIMKMRSTFQFRGFLCISCMQGLLFHHFSPFSSISSSASSLLTTTTTRTNADEGTTFLKTNVIMQQRNVGI